MEKYPAWSPRPVIRWGILGCGDVTEVKSGPGLQKAAGSQLVAVMRRDAAKAADYARRHGVSKWHNDADALIRDPEVDAVYVATPPGSHCEYALRVAAAGKPAYVEKPMARHAPECERMIVAFARAGLPLFVAYYRRAQPRFLKVKELLEAGELGPLRAVECRLAAPPAPVSAAGVTPWRLEAAAAGGGLLLDVGSHMLDMLDFLLGPLEFIEGHAANRGGRQAVEDYVRVRFRAAGGVTGVGEWDFHAAQRQDRIVLRGAAGALEFSVFGTEPVRLVPAAGAAREWDFPPLPHVGQPMIQTVVDALRGVGECAGTGAAALRTTRFMDRALDDYYGGRADEFWNRTNWPGWNGAPRA